MTRRALLSVSRKDGIVELAKGLAARGFEVLSTGGTALELQEAGVPVTGVSQATGFPEILDGRVKTLHPKIHGGILARREKPDHLEALEKHAITPIDVVVVNLYPFEDKVAKGASFDEALEYVDIEIRLALPRELMEPGSGAIGTRTHHEGSLNWSGAYVTPRDGQMFNDVTGAWYVPAVFPPPGGSPTAMYLALQHGLLVANYPLTDDDVSDGLPALVAPYAARCFGLTTTPLRLSQVRNERRPDSPYASLRQCAAELRRAEDLYRRYGIPYLNSSTRSVEEMSAVIIQTMDLRT